MATIVRCAGLTTLGGAGRRVTNAFSGDRLQTVQFRHHPLLAQNREALLALAERRGLRKVRVFGSMARGDDGPNSDMDLLVDAPPRTLALALCGFAIDDEELLDKSADVLTEGFLYPAMRERVFNEAVPL